MTQQFKSVIGGVAHHLPDNVVTNSDLEKMMETSDAWIQERTGIRERRWVDTEDKTSDLGVKAVEKLLQKVELNRNEIDLLIAGTLSPDLYFPGIGSIMQKKLNLPNVGAMDIRTQCSAFPYSLATADGLARTGVYRNIVIVGAELHSPVLDKTTRGRDVAVLFGDGAAATLVKAVPLGDNESRPTAQNTVSGVIDTLLGSDGNGAGILTIKSPGLATPGFVNHDVVEKGEYFPYMEGRTVFKHAVTRMLECSSSLLKRNNITAQDIDLLVPHQANLRINDAVADRMKIPADKVFNNIQKYGNTTAATIPLCLSEAESEGKLKKGDLVLTVAFGAGFTWGANLIRW